MNYKGIMSKVTSLELLSVPMKGHWEKIKNFSLPSSVVTLMGLKHTIFLPWNTRLESWQDLFFPTLEVPGSVFSNGSLDLWL